MKNASRLLAMLLAVAMFAAVAFTVSAFDDVNVEDDCYTAVNTLVSLNVIKGKTETEFAPDDAVTREQMAALMSRLYTTVAVENGGNYTPFTDLDDPYYNSVISWCYDAGVINGTTPSTFEPKANIMLQDAVTMACRLIGYNDLTYPLGYLTKGRLIGLLDGLEEVAYDKELTRGETAILLYNTLDADGAEIISGSTVEWYENDKGDSYPLVVSYERNFTIAYDVYNFKTTTFQVVGTENFSLTVRGETAADDKEYARGDEDAFNLVEVNAKKQIIGKEDTKNFEDLMIAEDTNSDDYILTFIEVLYKGESLDDDDAVILSTALVTNTDAQDEIGVYYKKNDAGKLAPVDNKILLNGKAVDADDYVYVIDNATGVIEKLNKNLSAAYPVFYQADSKETGAYAELKYDLDNDGKLDAVLFMPMDLYKVKNITSKGVYTFENVNNSKVADIKIDTKDEDATEVLVILADEVAKDDYVLVYTFGNYTYVAEVLEPVIGVVTKSVNGKVTLDNGDVLTFAKDNTPIVNGPKDDKGTPLNNFTLNGDEVAIYVVNDKIVYSANANSIGYTPNTYAFIVNDADDETYVDTEDGTVEKVYNVIAFINGKASTIPTDRDYTEDYTGEDGKKLTWDSYHQTMVTIEKTKDGKYTLTPSLKPVTGYEIAKTDVTINYNTVTKFYKIDGEIVTLDENSELYVRNNKAGKDGDKYDTVKRYTMNNAPTSAFSDGQKIDTVVLRENKNADGKVTSYTLVCGYVNVPASTPFGDGYDYEDYRIVLSSGETYDAKKGESYATYEILNPVTGEITDFVDTNTSVPSANKGDLVRFKSNNMINPESYSYEIVSSSASHISNMLDMIQIDRVIDDSIITFYRGTDGKTKLTNDKNGAELLINGVKAVVVTEDEEGNIEVEVTDDYSDLDGKVARIYTHSDYSYKAKYIVVLPYQWLTGADANDLADDLFEDLSAYTDYELAK